MKYLLLSLLLSFSAISAENSFDRLNPVGSFIYYGGATCPQGYLKNDGSAISRVLYPKLFSAFGVSYGVGDGSTTFNLPKYDWFVDANIGGANPSLTASTPYTSIESASFDMVVNTGSAAVTIPCSATNASTGITCAAGNESVGAVFTPPWPGNFVACFYGTINTANTSSGAGIQWVETGIADQTVVQNGKSVTSVLGGSASTTGMPLSNCGTFTFSSTSKRALRLFAASAGTNGLYMDRAAGGLGSRDGHIFIYPVNPIGNCVKY